MLPAIYLNLDSIFTNYEKLPRIVDYIFIKLTLINKFQVNVKIFHQLKMLILKPKITYYTRAHFVVVYKN